MNHLYALLVALMFANAAAAPPTVVVPGPDAHHAISGAIGAVSYTVEDLDIPPDPVGPFTVEVDLGGQIVHLDLAPSSVRAPGFTVEVSDGRGGLVQITPPPARTVAGVVRESGDRVAGALLAQGLRVIILTNTGTWSIGPLSEIVPAPRERHFVVHSSDEFDLGGTCPGGIPVGDAFGRQDPRGGGDERGTIRVIELRAEADFDLFVRNASDVANTIADVETVIQSFNIVYERDVNLTASLLSVLVRTTAEDDPYTGITDSGDLLNAFRTWWNTNQNDQPRDLAHLFTGKELDGSTIGVAYLAVVCNSSSFSYGLSQTRFSLNLSRRVGLTAHEIGHNFSASHCNGATPCNIMCSSINGCDGLGLPNFGPDSIASITNHVAGTSCLAPGEGQPLAMPVIDNFLASSFDPNTWAIIDGAVISTDASGEPSPPFTALLSQSSELSTDVIGLVGPFDRPVTVSFWAQAESIESGERLEVIYTPLNNSTSIIHSISAPPAGFSTVGPVRLIVPAGALGTDTSIGFRSTGNNVDDLWYIDGVRIEQAPDPDLNLIEPFAGTVIDQWVWPATSGAAINAGSPNPPSSPYVLNLDRTDWVESRITPADELLLNQDVWVRLFLQSNNVEPSKSFRVRFLQSNGQWATVWEHKPRSTERSSFKPIAFPLPAQAEHDTLAVRFEALGTEGNDDWFVDNVSITSGPVHALPIVDGFDDPDEMIDPTSWFPIEGAVINQGASGEPSGTSSVNLDWQDRLTSRAVDLSGVPGSEQLVLSLWLQHNDVENGKTLFFDYRRSNGSWANAWSYTSSSSSRITVGFLDIPFPAEALHAGAQVRLRAEGADGSDDWFIDDVVLDTQVGASLPIADSFPNTVLSPLVWAADDNVAINSGAFNEPSPPFVMNLDRDEFAYTQEINATAPGDGVVVRFWLERNGVEPGKSLFVEYTDANGAWPDAEVFTSTEVTRTTYGFVNVPLGTDAARNDLKVRLRVNGVDGSDDWFVDDFQVLAFNGLDTPDTQSFLTARLDPVFWNPVVGSPVINQGALNEPSPPLALNLDSGEVLETGRINGLTMSQAPTLSFWVQHNGVEPGETLTVEWRDVSSSWNPLATLVSDSTARSPGELVTLDLPQAAAHSQLRLRFSVSGTEPNDDWFIDDLFIGSKTTLAVPFDEDFESAGVSGLRNWAFVTGMVTQAAANEPSGIFSLRFTSGGQAITLPMPLGGQAQPLYARFWGEHTGTIWQDAMILRYRDAQGVDQVLGRLEAADASDGDFVMFEVELPPEAFHDAFTLELLMIPTSTGVFFVDDVQVDDQQLGPSCPADLNGDGVLDFFDIQVFLNAYDAQDPAADFNNDGLFDFFDVQIFLGLFGAGCP
jgi:metallopeptidase family M12-like protein